MESRWSWWWWRYCGHRTSAAVTLSQLPAVWRVTCHEWPLWILSYSGATCRPVHRAQCWVPPNSGYWSDHMWQVQQWGEDGGGWWWVKQNYLKALPVISKVTYKYIEHCLQLSVFAKKCFAQCPCFETILPLVHHIYSYNIWRHNAPMFMCYLVTNNDGEVSVSALLWRVVTISVTRDSDQLPGDMCSASHHHHDMSPPYCSTWPGHVTRTPAPAISNS